MLRKVADEDQDDAMHDVYTIIYIILLLYALWTHKAPEGQPANCKLHYMVVNSLFFSNYGFYF